MLFQVAAPALALAGLAAAGPCKPSSSSSIDWVNKYTATGTAAVAAAAATAKTSSPTSHVKGKAFDRVVYIYGENQDYAKANGDANYKYFASLGLTLTNYFGVTHPSEPNYVAAVAGDYFGMQNDDFTQIPQNVSTVIDLLEDKGISWAFYQEDMPFSGYEGMAYVNTANGANDYVRKHNGAVIANSVASSEQRLSQIKNLSLIDIGKSQFHNDLKANKLPQWMFITPNMTSDGHDTNVQVAGQWLRTFLDPLLKDKNFMQNTLVVITFDENETYTIRNNIFTVLIGDALPKSLIGKQDNTFYNHYSEIATAQANWDLHTLGRWDVGANPYAWVAEKAGEKVREWQCEDDLDAHFWNASYAGIYNDAGGNHLFPAPNLKLDKSFSGRSILSSIKKTWANSNLEAYYEDTVETPDGLHPPPNYKPVSTN